MKGSTPGMRARSMSVLFRQARLARHATTAAWTLLVFAAFSAICACSGSSNPTLVVTPGCGDRGAFCVTACNLGCTDVGCGISEIAVNQPLIFTFSSEVDPDSVNTRTFRIATATGDAPVGSYLVQKNVVFFLPDTRTVQNKAFFGFTANATYDMVIPSADEALETIKSLAGTPVTETFACKLNVTRGIVDFDGKPPIANLLVPSPSQLTSVPVDTSIVVEFSEIVDATTVLGAGGPRGILYEVTSLDTLGNCGTGGIPIGGTMTVTVNKVTQRTQAIFRPGRTLPGNKCVRVRVTEQVKDLSGKRATSTSFEFKTEAKAQKPKTLTVDFSNASQRDPLRDGWTWKAGAARPATVGGSGVLGDFDPRFGVDTGKLDAKGRRIFEWDTENTTIPATNTLTGQSIKVTDGVFEFTSFVVDKVEIKNKDPKLPPDVYPVYLRFKGKKPPVIKATGQIRIEGIVDCSALTPTVPSLIGPPGNKRGPDRGQAGFAGGPGGGAGGKGGDIPGLTKPNSVINGAAGQDLVLQSGHPLLSVIKGTGGGGSLANPTTGKASDVVYTNFAVICRMIAAGGGGGGNVSAPAGGTAVASATGPTSKDLGKPSAGGKKIDLSTLLTRNEPSSVLFRIGGAGGGGAGLCPLGNISGSTFKWSSGGGGAGGGGALQLKSGGDVLLGSRASILARGGDGWRTLGDLGTPFNPCPGGSGSGGSVLVQAGGLPDLRGEINVTGGTAGKLDDAIGNQVISWGGKGGDGLIRIEANPQPDYRSFANFKPAAAPINAGLLREVDRDDNSLLVSAWLDTGEFFPPTYVSYEIDATIDGVAKTFSDLAGGTRAQTGQALVLYVQGAQLDDETKKPDPLTISSWFEGSVAALTRNGGNAYRFAVKAVRSKTTTGTIVVKAVRVTIRS